MNYTTDCLIIGSGAAGLTLALTLAKKAKVIVLSKENVCAGSTNYAQGGIASVYNIKDDDDSIQAHIKDTCIAGGFFTAEPPGKACNKCTSRDFENCFGEVSLAEEL